jgi:hypothetical protein
MSRRHGPVYEVQDAAVIGVPVAGRLAPLVGGTGLHTAGSSAVVAARNVLGRLSAQGLVASP